MSREDFVETDHPSLGVTPRISVGMPVYNAGEPLRLAVFSILAQTFADWEMLIIDDGSSDGSLDFLAGIDDARIRVLRDGMNKGLAARLNEAIDLARGEYFARMDQDDVSYPERFSRQLAYLEQHPEIDLLATGALRISEAGEALDRFPLAVTHEEICARPWQGFYFPHPTWMGRSAWFRKFRYQIPGPYFCEDQELLLRSYTTSRFACLPEVLFAYRLRDKVNPVKLRGTRLAVFGEQKKRFMQAGKPVLVVLAFAVLVLRLLLDGYRRWSGSGVAGRGLAGEELSRWVALRDRLTREAGNA